MPERQRLSADLRRDLLVVLFFGVFGALAALIKIPIPHTPLIIDVRWAFGFMGVALVRRRSAALLLTAMLCLAGEHEVGTARALLYNLTYALPFAAFVRLVHGHWLVRLRHPVAYAAGWLGLVLAGNQLFSTPIIWLIASAHKGAFAWSAALEGWAEQPFLEESVAVAVLSALGMAALRTHMALRANEAYLATTLDSIGDAVVVTDNEGRVTRMNPVAEALTGWQLADAQGQPLATIFRIENARTGEPVESPVDRVLREGVVVGLANHTRLIARDGTVRQIADSAAPIRAGDGTGQGVVMVFRDVTEDYARREELRASEERLRLLSDATSVGLLIHRDGRLLDANPHYYAMFGHTPEELKAAGANAMELTIAPEELAHVRACVGRGETRYETVAIHKSGARIPIRIHATTVEFDGRPARAAAVIDMSERHRIEEQILLQSMVLDQIADVVTITDMTGRILHVNDACCRTLGRPREEIVDQTIDTYGEDPEQGATQKEILDATLATGEWAGEVVNRGADGSAVHLLCRTRTVRNERGEAIALCGISTDITALKKAEASLRESEERWQFALEGAEAGVWDYRPETGECYYSPTWCGIIGYGPDELEPSFEGWRRLAHPDDLPHCLRELDRCLQGEIPFYRAEHRLRAKDGAYRWVLSRGKVMQRDHEGRAIRVIGTHTDITERRRMEERLRQSDKLEAIGQLAGGIAHDFNNQLGGIMGYADLLLHRIDDESLRPYAEKIVLAAERAGELTGQLLTFARKGRYTFAPVDLHRIVGDVVSMLEHTIDRRIRIEQILRARRAIVRGDATQLQNALLNLGINARDALPEGGTITFETESVEIRPEDDPIGLRPLPPGPYLQLRVRDNGVGMPADVAQRIFEPFFTTKTEGKGTGMGLAAVYGTVQAHSGAITVESAPEAGSVFRLLLPAASEAEHAPDDPAGADADADGGAERILLVDDEDNIRAVTRELLGAAGYEVDTCADGVEALEAFRAEPERHDLIVLDLMMPKLNGAEVFRAVRAERPDLPILLASGYSLDGDAAPLLEESHTEFVQKPFRGRELLRAVHRLLRARR